MVELYNYGLSKLEGFPGKLKEGDMTIKWGNSPQGRSPQSFYENEIEKGDWVKLSNEDITFVKCAADDPDVIGFVDSEPEMKGTQEIEDKEWGEYEPRSATIKLLGLFVKSVKLNNDNPVIAVGDSVKAGAVGRFTKGENDVTRTLQSAGASSGAFVAVLFGYCKLE